MKSVFLLLMFISSGLGHLTPPSTEHVWLDPNDPTAKYRQTENRESCTETIKNNDQYLRLILRQMMHELHVDYTIPEYVSRDVKVKISKYSMTVLSKYLTDENEDTANTRETIRSALADIFQVNDGYVENSWQEIMIKLQPFVFSLNIALLPAASIVIIKSLVKPKSFWILLVSTIFVISMYCGYNRKYQEAEARRFAHIQQMNSADACAPEGMFQRFSDSILSLVQYQQKSNCQKYIESQVVSIFFEISPIEVFSETVASGMFSFISEAAKHFKRFFRDLYEGTPIMAQIVMTVFLISTFGKIKTPFFSYEPILLSFLSKSVSKMVGWIENDDSSSNTTINALPQPTEHKLTLTMPPENKKSIEYPKSEQEEPKKGSSPTKPKKRSKKKIVLVEESSEDESLLKEEDSDKEWEKARNESSLSEISS